MPILNGTEKCSQVIRNRGIWRVCLFRWLRGTTRRHQKSLATDLRVRVRELRAPVTMSGFEHIHTKPCLNVRP